MATVKLNVGGTKMETNISTLKQSEYFKALLERWTTPENKNDELFIDEDPEIFKIILQKLRHPTAKIPDDFDKEVLNYYQIPINTNILMDIPQNTIKRYYKELSFGRNNITNRLNFEYNRIISLQMYYEGYQNFKIELINNDKNVVYDNYILDDFGIAFAFNIQSTFLSNIYKLNDEYLNVMNNLRCGLQITDKYQYINNNQKGIIVIDILYE
jgi:hypothetical protein